MLKKQIVVYTINTQAEFDHIYALGVKNIMTDNVPLIKEALKKYSVPLPTTNLLEKSQ